MVANMSAEYVCSLTPEALAKAKEELNEDPKERAGAIQTLREWISQQPHLTASTETAFLLRYLRVSKFSQLLARERIERYASAIEERPDYLRSIDTTDPKLQPFYDSGYFLPLGYSYNGHKCLLMRPGTIDVEQKLYDKVSFFRGVYSAWLHSLGDENDCVHGHAFLCDLTGYSLKHQLYISVEDIRLFAILLQKAFPSRFKGIYYYNMTSFAEVSFQLLMPLLSKKFKERMHLCGNNLEKIYKIFPMEILPTLYLPDDYKGENAGTMQEMAAKYKAELHLPKNRDRILSEIGPAFSYDKSKKDKDAQQASFRKLNAD